MQDVSGGGGSGPAVPSHFGGRDPCLTPLQFKVVPAHQTVTDLEALGALIRGFAAVPGGLMPALHAVQHRAGYIDRALIPVLAHTFNITDAEVHGVISF